MSISIIVAMDLNGVIGKDNGLPWRIPADLKYFKEKTENNIIIMGRKTFESIGKPLKNRQNIILTKNKNILNNTIIQINSIEKVLSLGRILDNKEVFIIGGANIYKQFLPYTDKLYITQIYEKFEGDKLFPKINWNEWESIKSSIKEPGKDTKYQLVFNEYRRIK